MGPSALHLRAGVGGFLMGLANLVPGISGGTMLLITGVYAPFVDAVADVTRLRFPRSSLILLGIVAAGALVAIAGGAGPVKSLVTAHRWVMYSLFLGLTLGGVPVVWRIAGRRDPGLVLGTIAGLLVMIALSFAGQRQGGGTAWLVASGVAGASAMILPGVSGAYLLIVMGQYETILGAIAAFRDALARYSVDAHALRVLLPVGLGVVLGVVLVSNLIRWALERHPRPTYGLLLGLLLGSVVGVYPFQEADPVDPHRLRAFGPALWQVAASVSLIGCGCAATLLVDWAGARLEARSRG